MIAMAQALPTAVAELAPVPHSPLIDVTGFEGWLRAAHPGSRITFHRGHTLRRPPEQRPSERARTRRRGPRSTVSRTAAMRATRTGPRPPCSSSRHGDADLQLPRDPNPHAREAPPRRIPPAQTVGGHA